MVFEQDVCGDSVGNGGVVSGGTGELCLRVWVEGVVVQGVTVTRREGIFIVGGNLR